MKKKTLFLFLLCALLLSLLPACSFGGDGADLTVVTTVFPEYDWALTLTEGISAETEVINLLDTGMDLHSYQPTAADLVAIKRADLFVYVGGESDEWVENALKDPANKNRRVICLMDVLGEYALPEEEKPGMQSSGEEDEEEGALDEHVWLSLKNAVRFVGAMADALSGIVPEDAPKIQQNLTAYKEKLDALDARYEAAADGAKVKTLLFADRFPFLYLVKDYGLDYYAAFSGCSAESEASFETVVFLAARADELGLSRILILEGSDGAVASSVISATKAKNGTVLTLDSLQTSTSRDRAAGKTYLSAMESNLAVLIAATS